MQETLLDAAEKMDANAPELCGLVRLPEADLEGENGLFLLK